MEATTGAGPLKSFQSAERSNARDGERQRAAHCKNVTMAPTSRYLTDRQYVMRKPLFSAEQQMSILKKPHTWNPCDVEVKHRADRSGGSQRHTNTDSVTCPRQPTTSASFSLTRGNISTCSASREDPPSPLGISDLRGRTSCEESSRDPPFFGDSSGRCSLSSPPSEVRTLTSPLSPRFTSTLLAPSDTTQSHLSRRSQTNFMGGERRAGGGQTHLKKSSSVGHLKGQAYSSLSDMSMSPHQANYWACAIPRSLPPSPDRQSPGWDPDREYQALLDYTYPLRPGMSASERDGPSQEDQGLQDSGIELDRLCSSASLSGLDLTLSGANGAGKSRRRATIKADYKASDPHWRSGSSEGLLWASPLLSLTDPVGLSLESLDCIEDRVFCTALDGDGGIRGGCRYRPWPTLCPPSTAAFLHPTGVNGDWDEEYRPLPDRLEELQALSKEVREVTAMLCQPDTALGQSPGRGNTSLPCCIAPPEKPEAGERRQEGEAEEEAGEHKASTVPLSSVSPEASHRVGAQAEGGVGGGGGTSTWAALAEVEALVEQLSGLNLSCFHKRSPVERETASDSLMQRVQVFCSHLEELIQWLYTVVQRVETLAPPTVHIDSVKLSLAEYQSFQREVSAHRPLTSSVLHTGELLLRCLGSTSPVLRDTLGLIERQTRALETHTEHLFSSILLAMDSLTQPPG